ncbi:MAG: hypothetical protein C4551_05525 [Bacillota bacterium]|nr:MAG: hypothetical protein C4551_05525 [Bacillota bacterium]
MRSFFSPEGCAVVGASRDPAKPGHQILRSMLDAGFPSARLYPVNPRETAVAGLAAFPDLASVTGPLELAVVMVPPQVLDEVMEDVHLRVTARNDLRALVVASGGFSELGTAEGREREVRLIEAAGRAGVRLMGPNCIGIIDTHSRVDTTFLHGVVRRPGSVAFVSQSGAVGAWILQMLSAEAEPAGFSKFVSLGNMADVTMAETLDYLRLDGATRAVGVYLEGTSEPRPLLESIQALAADKPVVVLKTGRTDIGGSAATSHTGALAGPDRVWDGALRQAGALRVDGMQEFVDTLRVLAARLERAPSAEPPPTPMRVFLVTHAGGPGVYTMDLLASKGGLLEPAGVSERTKAVLKKAVPPLASVCRPEGHVDMTASATPAQHAQVVKAILEDPGVDALVTLDLPISFLPEEEVAGALAEAWKDVAAGTAAGRIFLPLLMHDRWSHRGRAILERAGLPALGSPERAVSALANVARYFTGRRSGAAPGRGPDRLPERSLGAGEPPRPGTEGVTLNEKDSATLLAGSQITFAPSFLTRDREDAVRAARELGFPVALKLCSGNVPHKVAAGAVRLGLRNPEEVAGAFDELILRAKELFGPKDSGLFPAGTDGVLVQAQAPPGLEVIAGAFRDPIFGPVVAVGRGGTAVGRDRPLFFRVAPLGPEDARDVVREALAEVFEAERARPARFGAPYGRGLSRLVEVLEGLSKLMLLRNDIVEADLNPVILYPDGQSYRGSNLVAVDALVRLSGE